MKSITEKQNENFTLIGNDLIDSIKDAHKLATFKALPKKELQELAAKQHLESAILTRENKLNKLFAKVALTKDAYTESDNQETLLKKHEVTGEDAAKIARLTSEIQTLNLRLGIEAATISRHETKLDKLFRKFP